MKHNYLIIFFAFFAAQLNAQITITSANNTPNVGDSYDFVMIQNPSFSSGGDGPDQTWDFSDAVGLDYPIDYISLINSEAPTTFPDANIVESDETSSVETYYYKSSTEFSQEGVLIPGIAEIIYTDDREFLKFPLTYNDVFDETFAGTVENILAMQTFDRAGTIEITGDAYGELILPYVTIDNVLRVRSVYEYTDEYQGFELYEYTDTVYSWYSASNQTQLASYTTVYANGSLVAHQASYLSEADFVNSINEELTTRPISIYPNPAKNYININNSSISNSINIHDLSGKIVQTENIQFGLQQIKLSDLSSGIYYIKYQLAEEVYTEKLIIE